VETAPSTAVYERELRIEASPETVWQYLVDPERVARWLGSPATGFEARPGAAYRVEIATGHVASGSFVECEEPRRLVHTWGWELEDESPLVPPGTSTIEIELVPADGGTLLRFTHRDLPTTEAVESHRVGWDHYLARLEVAAAGGDPGPDPWREARA
jgi:uncharacterized protein YndB with AHSA1/START domain